VLPLLRSIESISSCRDRSKLLSALLDALEVLLGRQARLGIYARSNDPQDGNGLTLRFGSKSRGVPGKLWTELAGKAQGGAMVVAASDGWHCGALVLESSELWVDEFILVFATNHPADAGEIDAIESLARIFGNQIRLLDYSELDSLTGLLNRKTFDETFDRLLTNLARSPKKPLRPDKRDKGSSVSEYPAWLATLDIDHFKRINDSFGHLFGDEVLLRMGGLLRKTFRDGDRVFRFGGEEFVVIINVPDRESAEAGFERFRFALESHEFPQVGTVTCSIGFTLVSTNEVSTSVLGRSDQALYFAKNNGRNQICCYEQLLDQGLIVTAASSEEIAQSIDELFG
jgi:diguanylate cyclase (GGDEF)-like protein